MGNRTYALLTGLFVVLLGGTVAVVAWWMSGGETERLPYTVVSSREIAGLNESSPVSYRGVRGGTVVGIRFNPEDSREILIDINIDADLPVTQGTWATLRIQGITGLSQLALHDEGDNPAPLPTSADDPGRIPMRPGLLDHLADRGEQILGSVDRIGSSLEQLVSADNVDRVGNILANVEIASERLKDFDQRLDPVLDRLPELTDEALALLVELRALAKDLQTLPGQFEFLAREAQTLSATGQRLGADLHDDVTPALTRALDELAATGIELQRLSRQLREQPQSLLRGPQRSSPGPGEPGYRPPDDED